ncbi:hypothetical protein [Psychromicrobium lacuslunae]|uniref:Uncharacterized protein n=1 Tax=Psychromicrobium lacuslunae TaxID=1618207 RepID=A0A0D4C0P4_9MICC|nr:hypothetical protein [Psychromicrobium lacuslunae]AJT42247.1 hypothetical protein UM93_13435 [Psychromicrobium lacuslunae]
MNIIPAQISSSLAEAEQRELRKELELRRMMKEAAAEGRLSRSQHNWLERLIAGLATGRRVRSGQLPNCDSAAALLKATQ